MNNETELKKSAIISKALKKVCSSWSITNKELSEFCGLSEAIISHLKNGQYDFDYNSKSYQPLFIFLYIFNELDVYMGGNVYNQKSWLKSNNTALGGKPIELMKNFEGLVNVAQYIDNVREYEFR